MIHEIVAHGAALAPDRPALITETGTLSFSELEAAVHREAAGWAGLGGPGDRIAVVGDNTVDYVVALYAVPAAGRVLTLVNQRLHPDEQARLVDRVDAAVVTGDPDRLDRLRAADAGAGSRRWLPFGSPGPPRSPRGGDGRSRGPAGRTASDTAWLIHTSGTTGRPKGVPVSWANLTASLDAGHRGRPVEDGDVYLFPFPLCHVAAYNVLLQHRHGATVVLSRGFDADRVLETVARRRVTTLSLAPTMIVRLLEHPALAAADLSSLRSIGYGAAALPPEVRARARDRLGCELVEGYGMTELSGNAAFDGIPDEAVTLRVVDDEDRPVRPGASGEILARGAQVVEGYWDDPAATAASFRDGWFRTGDIGRYDPAGRLAVVDRKKDIIITGGENVASREIEDVLGAHPDVAEVAVVGVPDPEWGELVTAVIVPSAGADRAGLAAAVVGHSREHLAGFKTPRRIELVDRLPVNSTGKVDKAALRRSLSA